MNHGRRLRVALILGGAAACVGACSTIDATEDRVIIQYNSYYSGMAFSAAQRECGRFGRVAELVATRPGEPSWETAFTRTTISTFDCVVPTPVEQVPSGSTKRPSE
ncbi:MAG: hypothetical protein U1E42_01645 [Rhodospirillales bacterium]